MSTPETATTGPKPRRRVFSTAAVLSIAALALAGCGGEDSREESDPQEDLDPSGAEDQGVSPEEIAEAEGGDQPAELSEIEEGVWESSLDQTSVHISMLAGLERGHELFGYAPDFFSAEGERFEMRVAGELEGDSSTELDYTSDFQVRTFGDQTYQNVEAFVFDYEAQVPPEVEPEADAEQLAAAISAEGEWVDVSAGEPAVPRTPVAALEMLRTELHDSLGVDSLAELELEPAVDTRDGVNVWVYSNPQVEFAVLADQDSPLLMGFTVFPAGSAEGDAEGGAEGDAEAEADATAAGSAQELEVTVTQWNEADTPEAPEEAQIVDDAQLQEILAGFIETPGQS